jgi:protein NirF
VTPDGRYYLAGLFGEDGVALLDTWQPQPETRRILQSYGRGQEKLPVFKMPHLRGWSLAQGKAYLPAIGRHEVLVVAGGSWQEVGRIQVRGQPVFVMAQPDGRQVWVNFAFPDNGWVEVSLVQRGMSLNEDRVSTQE